VKMKVVAIKSIADVSSGNTPSRRKSEYWNGSIPWITTGELESGYVTASKECVTEKALKETALKLYHKGTVLIAMYGQGKTRGTAAVLGIEATVNQACAALTVHSGCPKFLFYQLQNSYHAIRRLSNTGNQENLNVEIIKNFKILWPDELEQQKIATILSTQDKVIELKEKLLAQKQQQKKYLMQQLLTGKLRLPDVNGEWTSVKLKELLIERNEKNVEQNHRICSVAVSKGVVDQIEHLGRSYAAADTSNYGVAHYGDIIYTKSPTGDFSLGIIKQNRMRENVAISPLYGIYKPISFSTGYLLNIYFESTINTKNYLNPIVQKGAKNTIAISNSAFLENKIFFPMDEATQSRIAKVFELTDHEIDLLQKSIEAEKQKKKALMQLLLTGKVRVKI
jgi:type I restriction enzyme S subunit